MQFVPFVPTQEQLFVMNLERSVVSGRQAAERVIEKFKKNNLARFIQSGTSSELSLMKSLWMHHRLRAVSFTFQGVDFTIDLMNLCISGDLSTAAFIMSQVTPDDMTQPYHFLSQDVINELRGIMAQEL
jgi:hypothetical protein